MGSSVLYPLLYSSNKATYLVYFAHTTSLDFVQQRCTTFQLHFLSIALSGITGHSISFQQAKVTWTMAPQAKKVEWEDRHTQRVVEGIIAAAYSGRKDIYTLPGLAGEVDDHGCNRISQKIQSILKGFAKDHGLDPAVVDQLKKGPIGGGNGASGVAGAGRSNGSPGGASGGKGKGKRKAAVVKSEADGAGMGGDVSPGKRARGKGKAAVVKEENGDKDGAMSTLSGVKQEVAKLEPVS